MEKKEEHALVLGLYGFIACNVLSRSKATTLASHARQDMGGSEYFSNFSNACTCYN